MNDDDDDKIDDDDDENEKNLRTYQGIFLQSEQLFNIRAGYLLS